MNASREPDTSEFSKPVINRENNGGRYKHMNEHKLTNDCVQTLRNVGRVPVGYLRMLWTDHLI